MEANIDEVNALQQEIHSAQYPRFDGPVSAIRHEFSSAAEATAHLKEKAVQFGTDIVGVCEIEPSDVYRGKTVTEPDS